MLTVRWLQKVLDLAKMVPKQLAKEAPWRHHPGCQGAQQALCIAFRQQLCSGNWQEGVYCQGKSGHSQGQKMFCCPLQQWSFSFKTGTSLHLITCLFIYTPRVRLNILQSPPSEHSDRTGVDSPNQVQRAMRVVIPEGSEDPKRQSLPCPIHTDTHTRKTFYIAPGRTLY